MKSKKIVLLLTLLVTVVMLNHIIGGTVAWISRTTPPVTNTFTYGKVDIKLTETDTMIDNDNDQLTNTYLLDLENKNIIKDAKITIDKDSEDCWVFVKLEKNDTFDTYLSYEVSEEWKQLPSYENVYYMEVEKSDEKITINVLKNNTVILKDVEKELLNMLTDETYPTLKVQGYAIQKEGIETPIEAWSLLKDYASNQ